MGPVAVAIQWIVTVAAQQTIQGLIVRTLLTIGAQMAFQALSPKPKMGADSAASGVEQQRQLGEATPRAIALGWTIVAGSEGALWASGDGDDNRFNTRVIVISDWPTQLQKVWVRGRELTFEGDINTGWFACNQYRSKSGAARVWMRFLRGDWNQAADPLLISYANANGSWTSDDRLRGVSALLIRREYDVDAFQSGAPDNDDLRVEVRNAPVYDWRDATQSLTDVTTWKPSENPVVLLENALCLLRAPAQFSPGSTDPIVGPGLDFSRRPLAKLTAMANICDELVSGQPRYRAGGVVTSTMNGRAIIERFAAACAGSWVSSGEGGYLRPGHVPTPVMEIPAGALQASASDRYDPWARPDAAVNTVIASYPDPALGWQITPLPAASDPAWVSAQGGVRSDPLDLSFVPYRDQAWRIATRRARGMQLMGARDFTGPHWLIELEPGDVVTAPDPALPYLSTRWWMVQRSVLMAKQDGLTTQISLVEIDSAIDAAPPAIGAAAGFTPSSLSRALAVPAVIFGQRIISAGAGGQYPEATFLIPDTASQGAGVVQLQGPSATSDTPSLAAAQIRNINLSRGLLVGEPVLSGWYRWRAAGRDVDGSVGAFDATWQAFQVTNNLISADTTNLRSLVNLLPDAQYDRAGVGGSRSQLYDNAPAASSLSRQVDAVYGAYTQIGTPTVAALAGGSYYGVALAPSQSAADAVPIAPGRIGYRALVSAVPASGTLTAAIDDYFVRLMGFREVDGVWDTSIVIPLDSTNQFLQTVEGFTDSATRRRWIMVAWIRVRAGVSVQVGLNVVNPAFFALPPGQTTVPQWLPSSNAAPRADSTTEVLPSLRASTQSVYVACTWQGVPISGQLPAYVQFTRLRGSTDVSSSTTWSIVGTPLCTCTISSAGLLTITAISASTDITVRSVRDGVTLDMIIRADKVLGAPPSTGSGGTTVQDTTLDAVSGTTMTQISDTMSVSTGSAGTITFSGDLGFTFSGTGTSGARARWQYRLGAGAWNDVATEFLSDFSAIGGTIEAEPGSITCSPTQTGLAASTVYQVRLMARRELASPSGAINFFGTAQAVGS